MVACGPSGDAGSSASGKASVTAAKSSATPASSTAAPPAASAAPAAATPSAGQKVAIKAVFEEFNGDYDGSKALFMKYENGPIDILIPKDCPQLTCAQFGKREEVLKVCPKGGAIEIELETPATGKTERQISFFNAGGTNGIDKVQLDLIVGDTQVSGTLSQEDKDTSAKGAFTASKCDTPK